MLCTIATLHTFYPKDTAKTGHYKTCMCHYQSLQIAPWSSQWFEEILFSLIWVVLLWFALIWVFFSSKFLLFSLNICNLGTHLAHPQMEQTQPNGTFIQYFTILSTYKPKELSNIHFLILYFKQLFNLTFSPTYKPCEKFKKIKLNTTTQTPIQQTTFHQYTSFTNYLYFLRYRSTSTSILHVFCTSKFELFDLKNPKIQNSYLVHYPQPKANHESPIDLKLILILTMKLLYTYFFLTLPADALIWLPPIWPVSAQIAQPTSNHPKTNAKNAFAITPLHSRLVPHENPDIHMSVQLSWIFSPVILLFVGDPSLFCNAKPCSFPVFLGDLKRLCCCRELNFWATWTRWLGDTNHLQAVSAKSMCAAVSQWRKISNLDLLGLFEFVWVKDNAWVRKLSSLNFWVFEGKKFKFLGSLNFTLHCTK